MNNNELMHYGVLGMKWGKRESSYSSTGVRAAATTAAVSAGAYAANRYLDSHQVTLNGERVSFSAQNVSDVVGVAKKVKDFMGYMY